MGRGERVPDGGPAVLLAGATVLLAALSAATWWIQPIVDYRLVWPIIRRPAAALVVVLALLTVASSVRRGARRRWKNTLAVAAALLAAAGVLVPVLEATPSVRTFALDAATGERRWDADSLTATAADGARVYAIDGERRLAAIHAADGRVVWRSELRLGTRDEPPVVVGDEVVAVVAEDGNVHGLDAASGRDEWAVPGPVVTMAGNGKRLVVVGADESVGASVVRSIDLRTGSERWSTHGRPCDSAVCAPAGWSRLAAPIRDGAVVVDPPSSRVVAFGDGGGEQWRADVRDARSLVAAGDLIVATSGTEVLVALDAGTGARRWEYRSGGHTFLGPATQQRLFLYTIGSGRDPGAIVALETGTGAVLWQTRLPTAAPGFAPPFVADSTIGIDATAGVVVLGAEQRVLALDAASGAVAWDVRHRIPGRSPRFRERGSFVDPVAGGGTIYFTALPPTERDTGGR